MRQYCHSEPDFQGFLHFGSADPRGPNFAEIHARGRRGRLEYDHRSLIPPWGHGLLRGEAGKPAMPVCFDRNGDALSSRRTGMVGGESRGMTPHSSSEFGGIQLIQRPFRRSTAADVGTTAHNRFTTGTIRTVMCAWMPGFRA